MSEKITTPEELDALLSQAGQDAEPLVVREGFRVWILTEDEMGQWWAWSWREEGESANPVHAEALTLPLTLLHPLRDAPTPPAEDREALADLLLTFLRPPKHGGSWTYSPQEAADAALAWFAARQPAVQTVSAETVVHHLLDVGRRVLAGDEDADLWGAVCGTARALDIEVTP